MDLSLFNETWKRTEKEPAFRIYNDAIRQARPGAFSLSPDVVEMVAEMSMGGFDRAKMLHHYRMLAELPFPTVWMEFDYNILLDFQAENASVSNKKLLASPEERVIGTPARLGFLMDRFKSGQPGFRITTVGWMPDWNQQVVDGAKADVKRKATFFPVVQNLYVGPGKGVLDINPQGRSQDATQILRFLNQDRGGFFPSMSWGASTFQDVDNEQDVDLAALNASPLHGTVCVELEPVIMNRLERERAEARQDRQSFAFRIRDIMQASMKEQVGDVRFIVAALAMINHVPVKYVPHKPKGSMLVGGRMRPFFETNVVHIDLPNSERRISVIDRHLRKNSEAAQRKQHDVRGHYRFADRQINDNWKLRFDIRKGRMRWSIRIAEHKRGNPELGIVQHLYDVRRRGEKDNPKRNHPVGEFAERV